MATNVEQNNNQNGLNSNRNKSTINLRNQNLSSLSSDYLYHLGITVTPELKETFGDIKYVCMGGTPQRMKTFAEHMIKVLNYKFPAGTTLLDLCEKGHRYGMYKVGPILAVSHGMGMPSLSILLHEMAKLMHYAECDRPVFIRIGTSGGIGVKPGTVVVTSDPVNGFFENKHEHLILGRRVERPAILDKLLAHELISCSEPTDGFQVVAGKTLATDDFYEEQGRTDGAICCHTEAEKFEFLEKAYLNGVRNIEMESTMLGSLTNMLKIRAADVCVTLLDRRHGDQVNITKEEKEEMELRPQIIVGRYIMRDMQKSN